MEAAKPIACTLIEGSVSLHVTAVRLMSRTVL
jgi:hypothetical protein